MSKPSYILDGSTSTPRLSKPWPSTAPWLHISATGLAITDEEIETLKTQLLE